jgi:carbonic anhydrase/acetyltransferase-like protein (isoleucine patch superfamily)
VVVNALRWWLRGLRRVAVGAASTARISYLRLAYPDVSISFDSYIGPGCQFNIGRGSRVVLRQVHFGRGCEVDVGDGAQLWLASVWIGQHSVLAVGEGIRIGAGTMIAEMSVIRDANLSRSGGRPLTDGRHVAAAITIGRDVWLGARSTVLRGVTIGDSATVGAGAVVTRDVAAGTTVVGVPARVRPASIPLPTDRRHRTPSASRTVAPQRAP